MGKAAATHLHRYLPNECYTHRHVHMYVCMYLPKVPMHTHTSGLAFSRLISFPFLFISKPLVTLDYVLTYIPRLTSLAYA